MVTRLSGGLTPGDGADPRTFPAIWNATATEIETAQSDIDAIEAKNVPAFGTATPSDGQVLAYSTAINAYEPSAAVGDLDSLSDVTIGTAVSDGDLLAYDSGTSEWVNQALESAQLPAGSVLQVVRATDTTDRSTSSSSFVDTGMSVTITPISASSTIYVVANVRCNVEDNSGSFGTMDLQITDSSNVALSGAEFISESITANNSTIVRKNSVSNLIGFVTAGSTSAQTFKLRFKEFSTTSVTLQNSTNTGQLIAYEVAA